MNVLEKRLRWNDLAYWIILITLLIFMGWLVITGRAWK